MTLKERILTFLAERPGLWFDDDELTRALGVKQRQQVYTVCTRLGSEGKIQRDSKLRNSTLIPGDVVALVKESPVAVEAPSSPLTAAQFEAFAATVMSAHYGALLHQGSVSGVPKRFDFVSADYQIVGEAKYYTLVGGERHPPAKFSAIAEHVWLLERTSASQLFLVFGNNRRVPEQWLDRYGHLVRGIAFYFLTNDGVLEKLN